MEQSEVREMEQEQKKVQQKFSLLLLRSFSSCEEEEENLSLSALSRLLQRKKTKKPVSFLYLSPFQLPLQFLLLFLFPLL